MKKLYSLSILLILGLLFTENSYAQISITNGSDTICHDTLYDSGGAGGDYSNSEAITYTISPGTGNRLFFLLDSFNIAAGDTLRIHDGTANTDPVLFMVNDTSVVIPDTIFSTGLNLTFDFTSDGATVAYGWSLRWYTELTTTPSVTITANSNTICPVDNVLFSVTDSTGGGFSPAFQWRIAGADVGTDFKEHLASGLVDQDSAYVIMKQASCPQPMYWDTSNAEVITVNPDSTPNVAITPSADPECATTDVTFTVTDSAFSGDPTFAWTVNGGSMGTDFKEYVRSGQSNGDSVAVIMTPEVGGCYTKTADTAWHIMNVNPDSTPNVTITVSANPVCTGDSMIFYVTDSSNAGDPDFAWTVNGGASGGNIDTLYVAAPADGDSIAVIMTAEGGGCYSQTADTAWIIASVTAAITPNVSITATDNPTCAVDPVTFDVTDSSNAGNDPSFAWTLNGGAVGTDFRQYVLATATDGDSVGVIMTPEAGGCYSKATDSAWVIMTVNADSTPNVSVMASANPVCATSSVTLNVSDSAFAGNPSFAWTLNGGSVGGNSHQYVLASPSNNDSVAVIMTPEAGGCYSQTTDTAWIIITLLADSTPNVSINAVNNPTCSADPVTVFVTDSSNAGDPTFAWTLNGGASGGNIDTLHVASPTDNDSIAVIMTAEGGGCYTQAADTAWVILSVTTSQTVDVTLSVSDPSVCDGDSVTFTASPVAGGGAPNYTWEIDGTPVGGATSSTLSTNAFNNGEDVVVFLGSSLTTGCLIDSLTSDTITMVVNDLPTASISSSVDDSCATGQYPVGRGAATVGGTGGNVATDYAYQWDDPGSQTTAIADGLVAGTYNAVITDDSGCTDTATVILSSETPLSITNMTVVDASGFGQSNGSVSVTATGGNIFDNNPNTKDGYIHQWSDGFNNTSAGNAKYTNQNPNLATGFYTDTVIDLYGCKIDTTGFVDQPDQLDAGLISIQGASSANICEDDNVGQLDNDVAASGGIGGITYQWQYSNNLSTWTDISGANSNSLNWAQTISTSTFIRRRAHDGAAPNDTVYSNILFANHIADQTIIISGLNSPYCTNDAAVPITATPAGAGGSFDTSPAWVGGSTFFIPQFTAGGGSAYPVVYNYTDANSCFSTDTAYVTVNSATPVTFTMNITTFDPTDSLADLYDDSIATVSDSGGVFSGSGVIYNSILGTYFFDPGSVSEGTDTIFYTYTNANGCVTEVFQEVSVVSSIVKIYTNPIDDSEVHSCYDQSTDTIYIEFPSDTVFEYWLYIYGPNYNGFYRYPSLTSMLDTVDGPAGERVKFPINPKQFLPFAPTTYPYDSLQATPIGVTEINFRFYYKTVANPGWILKEQKLEMVNLGTATLAPSVGNSDGSAIYDPFQYCETVDSVTYKASFQSLGTRSTTKSFAYTGPGAAAKLTTPDVPEGFARLFPPAAGLGSEDLTFTYTDDATGCFIDTTYEVRVDQLPTVTINGLSNTSCANNGSINFWGTPFTASNGTFSSPTGSTIGLLQIDSTASFFAADSTKGAHEIRYFHTDTNGCSSGDTIFHVIDTLPELDMTIALSGNFSDGEVCASDNSEIVITGSVDQSVSTNIGDSIVGPGITYPYLSQAGQATFNPSVAMAGSHTIRFYYRNPGNNCSNYVDSVITVNALPNATFTISEGTFEACDDVSDSLHFTYTGGVTGTSKYVIGTDTVTGFYPFTNTDITPGTNTITNYFTETATTCENTFDLDVELHSLPTVSIDSLGVNTCANSGLVTFYGAPYALNRGIFGTATGTDAVLGLTHINGNNFATFQATDSSRGYHEFTYQYQDTNGCINRDTFAHVVDTLPVLDMTIALGGEFSDSTICVTDNNEIVITGSVDGNVSTNIGDSIRGPGVTYPYLSQDGQATFNPSVATSGTHTISFYYTEPGNNCFNFVDSTITVNALPDSSFDILEMDYNVCRTPADSLRFVYTGGQPGISTYFIGGDTVSGFYPWIGGSINPAIDFGSNTITHVFEHASTTCVNSATLDVTVDTFPVVNIDTSVLDYCYNAGNITFTGSPASPGAAQPSWFYSPGLAVNDSLFSTGDSTTSYSPVAGDALFSYEVSYNYVEPSTGCFSGDTMYIYIDTIPELFITHSSFDFDLRHCLGSSVSYEKWNDFSADTSSMSYLSGPGFIDSTDATFYPDTAGVGLHLVKYTSQNAGGCINSIYDTIEVKSTANADFAIPFGQDTVCVEPGDSIELTPVEPGGDFYISEFFNYFPAVNRGAFFHDDAFLDSANQITYISFLNGCNDTITKYVFVRDTPSVDFSLLLPDPYCYNADSVEIHVTSEFASLGQSYFRSKTYPFGDDPIFNFGGGVQNFNGLLDSSLLAPGDSTIRFGANVNFVDSLIFIDYVHVDQFGCEGIGMDYTEVIGIPQLSVSFFDGAVAGDSSVCALYDSVTIVGAATGATASGTVGGWFTTNGIGFVDSITDNSQAKFYAENSTDSTYAESLTYHFVDRTGDGCYNSLDFEVRIKQLPPTAFSIDNGDFMCADDIASTTTFYDNCAVCQTDNGGKGWPNVTVDWDVYRYDGVATTDGPWQLGVDGQIRPSYGNVFRDSARIDYYNVIEHTITDDDIGCVNSDFDTIYVFNFPAVDIVYNDSTVYCSNNGVVTFNATRTAVGGSYPAVFSSPDMFGGFADTLTAGQNSIQIPTGQLAVATSGLERTYKLKYYYTNDSTGCANDTTREFTLRTAPQLTLNLQNAKSFYCVYDTASRVQITVNAVPVDPSYGSGLLTGVGVDTTLGINNAYWNTKFVDDTNTYGAIRDTMTFYYVDSTTYCSDTATKYVVLRDQPNLRWRISNGTDSVCFYRQNAVEMAIEMQDSASGSWGGLPLGQNNYFRFHPNFSPPSDGTVSRKFVPEDDTYQKGQDGVTNTIHSIGRWGNDGCIDTIQSQIFTFAQPWTGFELEGVCAKYAAVLVGDTHLIDTVNDPFDGIAYYQWWIDGQERTNETGRVFIDTGNFNPGNHFLGLSVRSKRGCWSELPRIDTIVEFVAAPSAEFSWNMGDECFDGTQATVNFFSETELNMALPEINYFWHFGDGDSTSGDTTLRDVGHSYSSVDQFQVTLEVTQGDTTLGLQRLCVDSTVEWISIRPSFSEFPYEDNFDDGYSGWVSWTDEVNGERIDFGDLIFPTATVLPDGTPVVNNRAQYESPFRKKGAAEVWDVFTGAYSGDSSWIVSRMDYYEDSSGIVRDTGIAYNNLSQTVVTSPCFDFTSAERPMIILQERYEMEANDGVVIQYTWDADKPIEQVTWHNVGDFVESGNVHYESGINWYNKKNIFGSPGDQSDGQGKWGWTEKSSANVSDWVESRHAFEIGAPDSSYIRFRVAMGSNSDQRGKGFEFDDFEIRERQKKVLLEGFVNSSPAAAFEPLTDYNVNVIAPYASDVVDVQYHTAFPADDPMNQDNTADPSARSLFYSVGEIPVVRVDGNKYSGFMSSNDFGSWVHRPLALTDPVFKIDMTYDESSQGVSVTIRAVDSTATYPLTVDVHIATLETFINESSMSGSIYAGYDTTGFFNTLKKMYPSYTGTETSAGYHGWSETFTETIDFDNFYNAEDNYQIVAFVQDVNTKEVYQAEWVGFGKLGTYEIEYSDQIADGVDYIMYPNPTTGTTYMQFEEQLEDGYQLTIYNQVGMTVHQEWVPSGTTLHSFDMSHFKAGMYFVMLNDGSQEVAIKKLMVTQ